MKRHTILIFIILLLPSWAVGQNYSLDGLSSSTKEILDIATQLGEFHNEIVSCILETTLHTESDTFTSEILLASTESCIENMETGGPILQSEEAKNRFIAQFNEQVKEALSDSGRAMRKSDTTELSELVGVDLQYIEKYHDNINDSLFDTIEINNLTNKILIEIDKNDTLSMEEKYSEILAVEMQRHSLLLWTHYRKNNIVERMDRKFNRSRR